MRREEGRGKREEEGMAGQKAQAAGGFSAFLIASARQHYGCHAMGGDLRQSSLCWMPARLGQG